MEHLKRKKAIILPALLILMGWGLWVKSSQNSRVPTYGGEVISLSDILPFSRSRSQLDQDKQEVNRPLPPHRRAGLQQALALSEKVFQETEQLDFEHAPATDEEADEDDDSEVLETGEIPEADLDEEAEEQEKELARLKDQAEKNLQKQIEAEQRKLELNEQAEHQDRRTTSGHNAAVNFQENQNNQQDEDGPQGDDIAAAFEFWADRLIDSASFEATTQFILDYQSGRLSEGAFYSLIDSMLEESNPEVRRMAGIALTSTPSYLSFIRIATLLQQESYNSPLRDQLDQGLVYYRESRYLRVLERVLVESESPFTIILAARQLTQAARNYQARASEQNSEESEAQPIPSIFQRFVSILEDLSLSSDTEVNQEALSALNTIESLVS